jgi:hypothetical protein
MKGNKKPLCRTVISDKEVVYAQKSMPHLPLFVSLSGLPLKDA